MARNWQLFLVRHGLAEERGSDWPDDRRRPLTERGVNQMHQVGRGLARLGVDLDLILTSPLVRARQTADALASACRRAPGVVEIASLAPGMPQAAVFADLETHARRSRLALVGHEPDLGALASRLLGQRRPLVFRKGAVCRIDLDGLPPDHLGTLRWFATSKILRRRR